jgi:hypothetical protein
MKFPIYSVVVFIDMSEPARKMPSPAPTITKTTGEGTGNRKTIESTVQLRKRPDIERRKVIQY